MYFLGPPQNNVWILVTCDRASQCAAIIDSLKIYGLKTPQKGLVVVNGERTPEYLEVEMYLPEGWEIDYLQKNFGQGGALRYAFQKYPSEPFYGFIPDDEFVLSNDWDIKLSEAASDFNIAHGNNGDTSGAWPHGYLTLGGSLVRAVGNISPDGLWHLYFDNYWAHIGNELKLIKFCEGVKIDEHHHRRGNAPVDDTNRAALQYQKEDDRWFTDWRRDPSTKGAQATCQRVKQALRSYLQAKNTQ